MFLERVMMMASCGYFFFSGMICVCVCVCVCVCTCAMREYLRRANGSNAHAFSNVEIDENTSRTHHIHTASRSCEYARDFQITRMTKTLLANIALVRFLVPVNTHVIFKLPE